MGERKNSRLKPIDVEFVPTLFRTSFRSREVCFSAEDWRRLGDDMAAQYPQAWYIEQLGYSEAKQRDVKPSPLCGRHLTDIFNDRGRPDVFFDIVFAPNYEPEWFWAEETTYRKACWVRKRALEPTAYVHPSVLIHDSWDKQAPKYLTKGDVIFRYENSNKSHMALGAQFLRMVGRQLSKDDITWVEAPLYEAGEQTHRADKFGIGLDAMRWAREDRMHLLRGGSTWKRGEYYGFRPLPLTSDAEAAKD